LNPESCIEVNLPDKTITKVKLIRSTRSKRMCIKADLYGISIVSPIKQDIDEVRNFVNNNNSWILEKIKFYEKINNKLEYGPLQDDEIIYLGKKYNLKFVKDTIQYTVISENQMKITFHVKDRRTCKRNLVYWYKQQTKKLLDERIPFFGKKLSISYGKVRIRNQKFRWGSCSKEGNLNFNLFLSALPINMIDYIIIHELFHIIEFNHSDHFWKLLERVVPTYNDCRTWLRINGRYVLFK